LTKGCRQGFLLVQKLDQLFKNSFIPSLTLQASSLTNRLGPC
jgi:hypothetical protein